MRAFRRKFTVSNISDYFGDETPLAAARADRQLRVSCAKRRAALQRVLEIYGGPIEVLQADEGLSLLKSVNDAMTYAPYCPVGDDGKPGGLVELPPHLAPILVGDLHANVDNLLKILSENSVMENLDDGSAAIVFLGDAVHDENPEMLGSMRSSVLMMDLIFKLKLRYPNQIYFLIGNHDGFSPELTKHGVRQCQLWENYVKAIRGDAYRIELQRFYELSPMVALSADFVACHGGPPQRKVSREKIVNISQFANLSHELVWNRIQSPACPFGYTARDVRRFRKSLGLREDIPFIVAHTPLAKDETVWRNIGRVSQHHLVFSARPDQVGVFLRIDGEMQPRAYPAEPLCNWLNQRGQDELRFISKVHATAGSLQVAVGV